VPRGREKRCSFGAQCVPSLDGLTARCQCPQRCDDYGDSVGSTHRHTDHATSDVCSNSPQRCDDYGDSVGSTPVCGSDGRDYANSCEMIRATMWLPPAFGPRLPTRVR